MTTALVERAQAGDEAAFTELFNLHVDRCYAVAYRVLRDLDAAQDAVQQALLLAWRDLPRLRDPERFDAWLYRLVVNQCYQHMRRQRRWSIHVATLPEEGLPQRDGLVSVEERDALEGAFTRLSPEQRAVFVLHHHVGMPLAAIGEALGVPLGTVKSRLHYATQLLRGALTEPGDARSRRKATA